MKRKILSLLLTVTMMLGVLTGCGGGSGDSGSGSGSGSNKGGTGGSDNKGAASETIEVGIVLPTKDEPRWLQDQKQFETILGDAGFKYQVLYSQASSATEKTNVETLISKDMKVLIICAQDGAAAAAAVEAAKAA